MPSTSHADGLNDELPLRQHLVEILKNAGHIVSLPVENAFLNVPRHLFLPDIESDRAYRNDAITTKTQNGIAISSSSQPSIMAIMLEQLDLRPGHRVLEIGAGTGFNAALMAHIVGENGHVVTLDIDEDIVENAREHLSSAGFGRVQAIVGDGGLGYPDAAPYDRIVLTVGAWDIAPAWLEQLKPDGRLLLPLSIREGGQKSIAFDRVNNWLESVSIRDCGFMTLRGSFASPGGHVRLGPNPGLYISTGSTDAINGDAIYESLSGPFEDSLTGVEVSMVEVFSGLNLWLAMHEPRACGLSAQGEMADRDIVPWLFRWPTPFSQTAGLAEGASVSILIRPEGMIDQPSDNPFDTPPFELHVRSYGPDDALAQRLVEQVSAWNAAGRPASDGLRIRAFAIDADYAPLPGESVVDKRWTKLVIDWQR